ncbi:MAG: acyltransferase family protein [Mangrovibacterium sp.]
MVNINLKESKPHYQILDGLRGVAAIMVVVFHALEIYSTSHHDMWINHGYLAVDFFFMLSGFVIAYAYDDRWGKMSLKDFFKRRLIRLQPLVVVGSILGAAFFYLQYSEGMGWGVIAETPVWKMLLVMLIGCTIIPVGISQDIRGWSEMHPLNGPCWSLFFEYIANICYALFLRKASQRVLTALVVLAGAWSLYFVVNSPQGDFIGGWSVNAEQLTIGFTRLAFPFLAGMLLARIGKLKQVKHAFLFTSLLLVALFCVPRLGGHDALWVNGLYECFCLFLMFPLIIWIGAGGRVEGNIPNKVCKFFGDISYPIYITHYPIMYIQMAIIKNNQLNFANSWWISLLFVLAAIFVGYAALKLIDEPVRAWLKKRFL